LIEVEDWAEIRRLPRAEKLGTRTIAKRLGVARNTVREALRSDLPPRYVRRSPGSIVDAVEAKIRELLTDFPEMPATVIAAGCSPGRTQITRSRPITLRFERERERHDYLLPVA
jgi:transposase